jgi:flagellar biosynthesis GTPase FlhF
VLGRAAVEQEIARFLECGLPAKLVDESFKLVNQKVALRLLRSAAGTAMRPIRRSILATCILTTLWPATAECEPESLWNHNGSVMALHAVGAEHVIRYQEPRIGMRQEGVVSGTVRFEGTRTGNTYSGTAFVFSRRCGAHPFHVSGTASEEEREITMYGTAPAGFDAACRATIYSKHVVNFTFLRSVNPSPVIGDTSDRDQSAAEAAAKRASVEEAQAAKEGEEQRLRDLSEQQERQARDLREQQEHAERIRRELEQEDRRLAEVRDFSSRRDGCRKYDVEACDIALRSSHATQQDMIDLRNWRRVAEKLHADLDSCRTGSVPACVRDL